MSLSESPPPDAVYHPRRARLWCTAFVAILSGALVAWPQLNAARAAGGLPDAHGAALLLLGGVAIFAGNIALVAALLGLPRLTVTAEGIRLENVRGAKWARWDSLAFEATQPAPTRRGHPVWSNSARIVGPAISRNLRGKPLFEIPDAFNVPLATILQALHDRHHPAPAIDASPIAATPAEGDFGVAGFRYPWLTFALFGVLVAVFIAELRLAVSPPDQPLQPSVLTLLALGGLNHMSVVTNGEWYRLFTAPLLHVSLLHLLFNGLALLLAGSILERLVGRLWFLALFVAGALGGALMSLLLNPAEMTSVGASGGIMALLIALLVVSFRLPPGPARRQAQRRALPILVPSLLPLAATHAGGIQIDYGAHIGGALVGIAMGLMLLRSWPDANRLPRFQRPARAIALAGLLLIALSSAAVASNYRTYRLLAYLIPPDRVPRSRTEMAKHAPELAALYPHDPRVHVYLGIAHYEAEDYRGAEHEFRAALQAAEPFRFILGATFDNSARGTLAVVLLKEGKTSSAKDMARTACQAPPASQPPEALRKILVDQHLCD